MVKDFFKDSTIYVLPTIIMYGTNFFLLPLYTRVLNPSDYGILDMIRIFESLALLTVALEINQGLGRYYMDESNPQKKPPTFLLRLYLQQVVLLHSSFSVWFSPMVLLR